MKLFGFAVALVMGCGMAMAGDFKINGEFEKINDKGFPAGWIQNTGEWAKPFGVASVVKIVGKDGDIDNAVRIVSTAKRTEIYTAAQHPVKAGDMLEIEIKAKGTGKVVFGVYLYDEKGSWIMSQSETREVSADFQEFKAALTVKDGKAPAAKARFFFGTAPDSDVVVKEIEAEKKS